MRPLILDQYANQQLFKRILCNTFTSLGWLFWVYLWLPLIDAIILLLGPQPELATSTASHSILMLMSTLSAHASVVMIVVTAFFAWSLLQWLGKCFRHQSLRKRQVNVPYSLTPAIHTKEMVKSWRHAQNMVVSHDEAGGNIQFVDVIIPKKQTVSRVYPSLIFHTSKPNLNRRFGTNAGRIQL